MTHHGGPTAAHRADVVDPGPVARLVVVLATVGLLVLGLWRVRLGADLGDGTHVVALAVRMAQGDQVLTDEMNLQALGSLLAVPFTVAWLQLVGTEGIVLASRVFYLVLGLGVGVVAYRGLRTRFPVAAAFPAVVLMLVPTPYNLLVTSYNTVPVLSFGLATCAGLAALSTRSARWGVVAGAALALAVLAHPASLPTAAVLGGALLVLGRRGPAATGVLLGGGTLSALVLLVILLGPGLGALRDTVTWTAEYQASRPPPAVRLGTAAERYAEGLLSWRHVPALVLAAVATVPVLSWRSRAVAAAAVPVAVVAAAWWTALRGDLDREPVGLLSGAFVLLAVPLLLLPVVRWAAVTGDRDVRLLLVLTLPTAAVGVVSFSLVTSAAVTWGVGAPPAQPLLGALAAGTVVWASRHGTPALGAGVAVALVLCLLVIHPLRSFRDPPPWDLGGPVAAGPLAGLRTTEEHREADCQLRATVGAWAREGDGTFFYARPAGYLYGGAGMDTNLLWLSDFGAAGARTVQWWQEEDRWPDLAVVHLGTVRAAGGWEALAARDPVVAALDEEYGEPVELPGLLALRRDGTVPDPVLDHVAGCPAPVALTPGGGAPADGR
ncbi:MAG TPA: hypothetical protein VLO09_04210 [Ornithinimicrobium sp.]|nr:hypothetical protein [Ornithinimicrobium sp.]